MAHFLPLKIAPRLAGVGLNYCIRQSFFHHEFSKPAPTEEDKQQQKPQLSMQPPASKYKVFRDEDSMEIFDVLEERSRYQNQDLDVEVEADVEVDARYAGLNLKRGLHGVFDIEDLVAVLHKESADDVFVCTVPKELKYVDYMVVCSGRSYRHMLAIAEFVRHLFKKKRTRQDVLPKIEGEKSRDWMALDLGNIALHIFSPTVRETYDLESLWAIGSKYDKESNKPQDALTELFERNSKLWADLKPK